MPLLQQLLDIQLPIIQAPMAGVQGCALAQAVSNAGGLGSLPCALFTPKQIREELQALSRSTSNPYNVNFFCHTPPQPDTSREVAWRSLLAPYYQELGVESTAIPSGPGRTPFCDEVADIIEEFKPAVISFHFGLPSSNLLKRVRSWGSKILSSATTVAEAQWLEAQGVNAIIAQGIQAGGHRGNFLSDDLSGQTGTLELMQQIMRIVKTPVIAAGGIGDAKTVARAIALGAAGVQIGTTYMLCPEATTSTVHRAALKSDSHCTALTNLFTGRPARGIINRLMRELGPMNSSVPAFPLAAASIAPLRTAAERQGLGDFSPLWSGENVSGCKEVSASTLTEMLAAELQ